MNEYEINNNTQQAAVAAVPHKTASNLFNPRRFGLYCSKQIHEWKRGLTLQFLALAGIYTLLMFLFHSTDEEGLTPSIASTGTQIIIWLGFFVYIAKSASNLADQIGRCPPRRPRNTSPTCCGPWCSTPFSSSRLSS